LRYLPKPDVCVFCSKDLENEVGTHLQTISPSSQLLTIHNGVNIERFSPTKREAGADLNVGIIANLQFRKGHDEFIHMASILVKNYDNIWFHVIGGDLLQEPREAILKKLAMELNVQDKVTFHGQVPDVLNELDALDIVVCASHQEAFPIAILEAMAMQKAIVSTNVNGIPEAVIDGQSGILTSPHHPIQLATAVSKLIDNPQLRQELATNARTRVVEMFSSDVL
jgi:glycosyltransferase involved in cell wall biosynthesis